MGLFDQFLKKKKVQLPGGGGSPIGDGSDEVETPDAVKALDDIDAALKEAERINKAEAKKKEEDAIRDTLFKLSNRCRC